MSGSLYHVIAPLPFLSKYWLPSRPVCRCSMPPAPPPNVLVALLTKFFFCLYYPLAGFNNFVRGCTVYSPFYPPLSLFHRSLLCCLCRRKVLRCTGLLPNIAFGSVLPTKPPVERGPALTSECSIGPSLATCDRLIIQASGKDRLHRRAIPKCQMPSSQVQQFSLVFDV